MLLRLLTLFTTVSAAMADNPVRLIAHRGGVVNERIIENNLASIEAAVERGYWMLEVNQEVARQV